jgi:hypothetical protein
MPHPIEPRLLPGGKQVLLSCSGRLELWDLESRNRIWTAPGPAGHRYCSAVDVDMVEDGNVLIVAAEYDAPDNTGIDKYFSSCYFHALY